MIGFGIVLFWAYVGFFAGAFDMISTHDPLSQVSGMKNKVPGTPFRGAEEGDYAFYLLGVITLQETYSVELWTAPLYNCDRTIGHIIRIYGWNNLGSTCGLLWRKTRYPFIFCCKFNLSFPCDFIILFACNA